MDPREALVFDREHQFPVRAIQRLQLSSRSPIPAFRPKRLRRRPPRRGEIIEKLASSENRSDSLDDAHRPRWRRIREDLASQEVVPPSSLLGPRAAKQWHILLISKIQRMPPRHISVPSQIFNACDNGTRQDVTESHVPSCEPHEVCTGNYSEEDRTEFNDS